MNHHAYDHDGSGRPIPCDDGMRAELESLPDFIHEAMGEVHGGAMSAALKAGDDAEVGRIVREAVADYADFCLRHSPDSEEVTLRRLVRVYRGQVAA